MGPVVGEFRTAVAIVAPLLVLVAVVTVVAAVRSRHRRVVSTLGAGLFVGGFLLIVAATLLPREVGIDPGTNLTPFATMRTYLRHGDAVLTIRNVALNVALFVPAATGLVVWRRWRPVTVVAAGVLLSLAIEVAQWTLPLGRTADVDDVILNTAGAVVGAVAARIARAVLGPPVRRAAVSGRRVEVR